MKRRIARLLGSVLRQEGPCVSPEELAGAMTRAALFAAVPRARREHRSIRASAIDAANRDHHVLGEVVPAGWLRRQLGGVPPARSVCAEGV